MQDTRRNKMKPDIWMPMYWADFLADTLHLSRAEIGSYVLMIGAYWRRGSALPDDDESLRNICRCSQTEWMRCKGTMANFFQVGGGYWSHKRIDAEIAQAIENRESQRARTAAATAARTKQNVATDVTSNVTSNVTFTPSPSPSPSPTQSSSPSVAGEREGGREVAYPEMPNWELVKAHADRIGLVEWKARDWFDEMEGAGWRDYRNRQICKWDAVLNRVRSQWEAEGRPMQKPAANRYTPNGDRPKSALDIKTIIQAKETLASQIRAKFCSDTAIDATWSDTSKRAEFVKLKREVKELNQQLSSMA